MRTAGRSPATYAAAFVVAALRSLHSFHTATARAVEQLPVAAAIVRPTRLLCAAIPVRPSEPLLGAILHANAGPECVPVDAFRNAARATEHVSLIPDSDTHQWRSAGARVHFAALRAARLPDSDNDTSRRALRSERLVRGLESRSLAVPTAEGEGAGERALRPAQFI